MFKVTTFSDIHKTNCDIEIVGKNLGTLFLLTVLVQYLSLGLSVLHPHQYIWFVYFLYFLLVEPVSCEEQIKFPLRNHINLQHFLSQIIEHQGKQLSLE